MTNFSTTSRAQVPDWSTSVASIIYDNCSSCHHEGNIAPFSLMSYTDAVNHALNISAVVNAGLMPPWPADPDYRHFAYEAVLSEAEISTITEWVDNGTPSGNLNLAPPPPAFPAGGSMLQTIDYVVAIPPYTLQYNTDEYRYYAIPTSFTDTVYINQIEVMAGLDQLVHHADISFDMTGSSHLKDMLDPLSGFNSSTGYPNIDFYMNAWQPGGNIVSYPENWGIMVPPGADFVLEIHYGPGGEGLIDSTVMNLRFVKTPVDVRPITVEWTLYNSAPCLLDGPLVIPANTVKTFHQKSYAMPEDRSLISICPHQHMLGKSYRVWFITSDGDSVPLINIPQWDFHWQKYYTFQQIQKIPAGARIYSEASFDNTTNNPDNPNNPPETVSLGSTTEDEMLLCYFIFAAYMPEDEDIILDSSLIATGIPEITSNESLWIVYPNPAGDYFYIEQKNPSPYTSICLMNALGQVIEEKIIDNALVKFDLNPYNAGIYFVEMKTKDNRNIKKLIKH
jgi:hypothetical protein